jgi:hypothetical protein
MSEFGDIPLHGIQQQFENKVGIGLVIEDKVLMNLCVI